MQAAIYRAFRQPLVVETVADPSPSADGAVIEVAATGVCRSDWHGWMGHDPDIRLPHVPGHELSGVIAAVGSDVQRFAVGDRVTVPFVCGCGACPQCASDNAQVCDHQTQPGFTHWGSYAELVAIRHADFNLVALPDSVSHVAAASLGCRFATAFRAVVAQGGLGVESAEGAWLAVYGCGGVGLSAVMIGHAIGARVAAIDVTPEALAMATSLGADATINARLSSDVVTELRDLTAGGAQVSIDALGSRETCIQSIRSLRKRGKHVQVGLLAGPDSDPPIPMHLAIANELEIIGSHGMQASRYPTMLDMLSDGRLRPERLVTRTIQLDQAADELAHEAPQTHPGVTVIELLRKS
ncbi:MAG: zinc-dependent alcohol dehydrogenase family protein [Pseudomonadota bacterium]